MTKAEEVLVHRRRGRWIREARERRNLTLAALAEALGYADGQATVSLWEKGERPVPASKFQVIARVLGLPDRFLVRPPMTDAERLEEAIRSASDAERADWDVEVEQVRAVDAAPTAALRTRLA